jgi:hypothetical protein
MRFTAALGMRLGAALLAMLPAATFVAPSAAAAPSPAPVASTSACIGTAHNFEPVGLDEALSHSIDDPRVLALIDRLSHLDGGAQQALLSATAAKRSAAALAAADAAVRDACTGQEIRFAVARFEVFAARLWDQSTVDDGRLLAFAEGPLIGALSALTTGNRLPADVASALQAGFPVVAVVDPPVPSPCTAPDADPRVSLEVPLSYPPGAVTGSGSADVRVKVDLDAHGFVRSAELYRVQTDAARRTAFGDETLVAVGASRYQPGVRACRPYGGSFLFRARYSGAS